ncbi:methyltransferase domain-containing protein [Streptomyces sp. NPDC020965]|uniref:methyltransferase domain-containing protein n=1 Tax=Streptomyces sp. NPDC020965 TaxID=3365105 RepID=UPI003799BEDE
MQDPTWLSRAQRLADALAAQGDLRSPHWRRALEDTPRHLFLPSYFLAQEGVPTPWLRRTEDDGEAWLGPVYTDRALVTRFQDGGTPQRDGTVTGVPTCSSSPPGLTLRMLELLDIRPTDDVLDIGTGTGYQAALIAHRLADPYQLVTADIEPELTAQAHRALADLGHQPQLVTTDATSHAWPRTFDRVIVSCALPRVGETLRAAVRPGGRVVVNLFPPLNHTLVTLDRRPDGSLHGRFHPDGGSFMPARHHTRTRPPAAPRVGWRGGRAAVPLEAFDDPRFLFLLAAHLPGARLQCESDGALTLRELVLPDGAWAEGVYADGRPGRFHEGGERGIWGSVERWWAWYTERGRPAWDRFGLTVTAEGDHRLWYGDPRRARGLGPAHGLSVTGAGQGTAKGHGHTGHGTHGTREGNPGRTRRTQGLRPPGATEGPGSGPGLRAPACAPSPTGAHSAVAVRGPGMRDYAWGRKSSRNSSVSIPS